MLLDVASLFDYTKLNIPVEVIRGRSEGPCLFISAAIHGDEINGVEIIKRLLLRKEINKLNGTLIVVPVVNVFGFNSKSRYLPDRRDLNRCFPGSNKGSLASRLAHIFMREIVNKCTHGIDLHTGAINRTNLPQVRACLDDPATNSLARNFGAPVIINSKLRDGSLREAARKRGLITLLYEGGEALRYDEEVIDLGVNGCLSVMKKIKLIDGNKSKPTKAVIKSRKVNESSWVRAPRSGAFRSMVKLGAYVKKGTLLAEISDPFGSNIAQIKSTQSGIIIGKSQIPLVNRGDAMFHIAVTQRET